MAMPVSVTQNIELCTHALFGITIVSIPDKEQTIPDRSVKYRTAGNPSSLVFHITWLLETENGGE